MNPILVHPVIRIAFAVVTILIVLRVHGFTRSPSALTAQARSAAEATGIPFQAAVRRTLIARFAIVLLPAGNLLPVLGEPWGFRLALTLLATFVGAGLLLVSERPPARPIRPGWMANPDVWWRDAEEAASQHDAAARP